MSLAEFSAVPTSNRQLEHFVDAIQGVAPKVTNLEDGLCSQKLIEQAYGSIK